MGRISAPEYFQRCSDRGIPEVCRRPAASAHPSVSAESTGGAGGVSVFVSCLEELNGGSFNFRNDRRSFCKSCI